MERHGGSTYYNHVHCKNKWFLQEPLRVLQPGKHREPFNGSLKNHSKGSSYGSWNGSSKGSSYGSSEEPSFGSSFCLPKNLLWVLNVAKMVL